MTLALESQGEGKGGDRKGESLGESGDNQTEEPPAGYGSDPHLTSSKPHRSSKRKRHDDDDDDDQRRRPNEPDDDEERRRLHVQVQRLQGVNAELQASVSDTLDRAWLRWHCVHGNGLRLDRASP